MTDHNFWVRHREQDIVTNNQWTASATGRMLAADMVNFRRSFEQAASRAAVNFTLNQISIPDHREEDHVTTTDEAVVVNASSVSVVPIPASDDTGSFFLTRSVLKQLGSCGQYQRTFTNRFPVSEFPNGIEINEENCRRYWRDWDWDWACSRMLNFEGQGEVDRLMRSRSEANRQLGTGSERRAAAFGRIFSTRVRLRHPDMLTVRDRAALQADQDAIEEVMQVRQNIASRERDIERYASSIEQLRTHNETDRQRLPALEEAAAAPLQRQAEQKHRDAVMAMERMKERFEKAQEAVQTATAEVERFAALVQAQEAQQVSES